MSRASPFPVRRPRSPSQSSAIGSIQTSSFSPSRPLQSNLPPSPQIGPNGSPVTSNPRGGPSLPQRSGLRTRFTREDSVSDRSSNRDSMSTTYSDVPQLLRSRNGEQGVPDNSNDTRSRLQPLSRTDTADSEESPITPTLSAVISAFQSAGARKRSMTNGSEDAEYERKREREMQAEKIRQQRIKDKAPGRRVKGKAKAGDIDAVLDQIKDEWEFVIDPDFNSVDLALQLLDNSSVGKDMASFRKTKQMLSKALKGSVDRHYQAFAAALPHHSSLVNRLTTVQSQIGEARMTLQEAKDALGNKRGDLVQLWSRGQTLEEMMRILDQIEYLKSVPEVLETLISEKRFLQASGLLIRSLKIINGHDMTEIGAVADLRSSLNGQEMILREILVDELQSHLYLKSFWCESRWAAYTPNQQMLPKVEFEDDLSPAPINMNESQSSPVSPSDPSSRLNRYLHDLVIRPNDSPHVESDAFSGQSFASLTNPPNSFITGSNIRNPEGDSFAYMETLLESLAVLGKLGNALDIVSQRLPAEIYSLVETTLDEVGERAEYSKRGSAYAGLGSAKSDGVYTYTFSGLSPSGPEQNQTGVLLNASCLRSIALESSTKRVDHEILNDFFWTLYSKLDAVTQGLRLVYDVANRIGSRRDFKDTSGTKPGALFPLPEIWAMMETEVRTLLNVYLTDDEQGSISSRNPISSINEILRDNKFSRDKANFLFRFADVDTKFARKASKSYENELIRVLKDTVPGLVHGAENAAQMPSISVGLDNQFSGAIQRHRLLVRPDTFNVSVLFRPTLAFLNRVSEILPQGIESARSSSAVLDDFVLKVYLPQLEEKVSMLFHKAVTRPDAFQADPLSARLSKEPLIKASMQLMALVNSLCAMLRTTPFHRENHARLILSVVIQFYQRCSDRYQDLVIFKTPGEPDREPQVSLAAQWAQRSELAPCLSELYEASESDKSKQEYLYRQETHLELGLISGGIVTSGAFMPSIRNLSALGSLHRSLTWFVAALNALKASSEDFFHPTTPQHLPQSAMPFTPSIPQLPPESSAEILKLPLSREMALRFQALLKTYDQLARLILDTIRIDVRCRAIHHLNLSMRHGHYFLDAEAGEPDPHIIDLNRELGKCEDAVLSTLPKREHHFIFVGLGPLLESVLISHARYLRRVNAFGIKKLMRNMLALQQRIRSITNERQIADFEKAKRYYSMFFMSPAEMLESIREKQHFTFDEYQMMLMLQCGVDPAESEVGRAKATDRNYSAYVIDLHGLELENSAPEATS